MIRRLIDDLNTQIDQQKKVLQNLHTEKSQIQDKCPHDATEERDYTYSDIHKKGDYCKECDKLISIY